MSNTMTELETDVHTDPPSSAADRAAMLYLVHVRPAVRASISGLRAARDVGADLIACGSDHLGTLERLILGRVPNKILRGADCSVLIAPCAQQPNNMESSA